jgi:hypothetical protein
VAYANHYGNSFRVQLKPENFRDSDQAHEGYALCCRYFSLTKGTKVKIEIGAAHTGENKVNVVFDVISVDNGKQQTHFVNTYEFSPRKPLIIHHEFLARKALENFEIRLHSNSLGQLDIIKAEVSFSPD